jgi:mannan endo-1,4-beta-mannosidase
MSKTSPFVNMNRRQRIITVTSAFLLIVLSVTILATPRLREFVGGPSATEVALQREQARAADLKRRIELLNAQLESPRPIPTDRMLVAQVKDLKAQLADAEKKLKKGRPWVVDQEQLARAEDLARQNAILSQRLKMPRYTPPPIVKATRTKQQIIAMRKVFGLYTAQSPFVYSEFNLIQDQVHRNADISGYFQSWRDEYRPDAIKGAWARGDIPLLTWESMDQIGQVSAAANSRYSLPKILRGDFDPYLTRYARGIAGTGLPVIIRLDHEMNGNWYPWSECKATTDGCVSVNGNQRGDYARMWRHVHDIFERNGANKYVVWLWAPNRINQITRQPAPAKFYPGDKYVDMIGMSGYYRPYDKAATFGETHGRTLPLLREATRKKPIILAEVGATESGSRKNAWLFDMFANLNLPANRDVIGFVWFNFSVTSNGTTNDWRINSTPKSTRTMSQNLWTYGYGTARGPRPTFTATPTPKPSTSTPPTRPAAPARTSPVAAVVPTDRPAGSKPLPAPTTVATSSAAPSPPVTTGQ